MPEDDPAYVQSAPKVVTLEEFPIHVDQERVPKRWRYLKPIRQKLEKTYFQHLCSKEKMTGLLIEVASNNGGDISQMSIDKVGDLVFEAFMKRDDATSIKEQTKMRRSQVESIAHLKMSQTQFAHRHIKVS